MGINLSKSEIQQIVDALAAVSPSGGGSPTHTLQRKLTEITGVEPDEKRVTEHQKTIIRELLEFLESRG